MRSKAHNLKGVTDDRCNRPVCDSLLAHSLDDESIWNLHIQEENLPIAPQGEHQYSAHKLLSATCKAELSVLEDLQGAILLFLCSDMTFLWVLV